MSDRLEDGAEFAQSLNRSYGIEACYCVCELTSAAARSSLLDAFKEEGVRFRGLIKVAGRDYEVGLLTRTRAELAYLVDLMIGANLDLTHGVLNLRHPGQRFMLINIGCLAAFFPMPYKPTYSPAKRFLLNFTLTLREEIKDFGDALILCPAGLPTHASSIDKMKAQGLWGRATMVETALVARRTIDLALKGKGVYVPLKSPGEKYLFAILAFRQSGAALRDCWVSKRWSAL